MFTGNTESAESKISVVARGREVVELTEYGSIEIARTGLADEGCAQTMQRMTAIYRLTAVLAALALTAPTMAASAQPQSAASHETRPPPSVYPFKERFVNVDGLFLYFTEIGQGEPLVILHGGPGGSQNYFFPYLLPLARTNRLIFMDERGSGKSGRLENASGYTVENMADDVEALRKALGLKSINLLGHSFGGVVGQAYAFKFASSLSHLVLANTFHSTKALNDVWAGLESKIDPEHLRRIKELEQAGLFGKGKPWETGRYSAEYAELAWGWGYFPYMYGNHPNANYNPLVNLGINWDLFREMSGTGGEFVIDGNLVSVEFAERLRHLRVPTLIITGDQDAISFSMSLEMHSLVPGSVLTALPNSKHMTFVDQSAMFNDAVDAFVHSRPLSAAN
jgi:proline iminopeptidase